MKKEKKCSETFVKSGEDSTMIVCEGFSAIALKSENNNLFFSEEDRDKEKRYKDAITGHDACLIFKNYSDLIKLSQEIKFLAEKWRIYKAEKEDYLTIMGKSGSLTTLELLQALIEFCNNKSCECNSNKDKLCHYCLAKDRINTASDALRF